MSCENVDEVEAHLSDRWSEMAAVTEDAGSQFYEELKNAVRLRVDFDKDQVETMIKGLP